MTKQLDELAAQVEALKSLLAQHGIQQPARSVARPEERPDYIAHGSPEHARFLGLVEVGEGDKTVCLARFTSPRTGRVFRLEDELGAVRYYPNVDPEKAALLVLQQKVNELETVPEVPESAPAPFRPAAIYPS